jgi:hypothetical protein
VTGTPTVAIITSVTDAYDTLKTITPQIGVNAEYIAVTDGSEYAEPGHGWKVIRLAEPGRMGLTPQDADRTHPNRLAKIAKCQPWVLTDAPYSIWVDASYRVFSPVFALDAIKCAHPIAQFIHPWRDCVYDEGRASLALAKYEDQREIIVNQMNEYQEIGHPAHWGLWATGVIVRQHTHEIKMMSSQWLSEIRRHSYQDQISEPVALRFCDLRPSPLPGDHITNPWLKYEGSARH